jgi:ferredoxin
MSPGLHRRLWVVPPLLGFLHRGRRRGGAWHPVDYEIPAALKTAPGIVRDPGQEDAANEQAPLRDWAAVHAETVHFILKHGWAYFLPCAPRSVRARKKAIRIAAGPRREPAAHTDPARLTAELKQEAARLGLSACGVAAYDEKYTYVEHRERQVGDRIVVCTFESEWAATQTAPSIRSEKAQLAATAELTTRMADLGQFLLDRGYRVKPFVTADGMSLHYAVEAGLGQLGMNGQLLTPQAGSRCRVGHLNTDAPLEVDHPVDFGIPAICDACKVCVRRCPSGAIPGRRLLHRGIEKAKINTARCVPVVAIAHHCAVCMKVCPIQRYGLKAVVEEFEATGEILGKGTDELEGYVFEGRTYAAGERPKLTDEWLAQVPFEDHPQTGGKNVFALDDL